MTTTPTVSQAESWRPGALYELADAWDSASTELRTRADELARTDRSIWTGNAADQGWQDLDTIAGATRDLANRFSAAANAARDGGAQLTDRRAAVLNLVLGIRADGYTVADDGTVTSASVMQERAGELTGQVRRALEQLGAADRDTAHNISQAFASALPGPTQLTTTWPVQAGDVVAGWPVLSQDRIAKQIKAMSAEQRQALIAAAPLPVGNTDGVPWDMRVAANRVNIASAIEAQQRFLERPAEDKVRDALAHGFGWQSDPVGAERLWVAVHADPSLRAGAIAYHDRIVNKCASFYRDLLAKTPDPTGRSSGLVDRQILGFDPAKSSLIELTGDLKAASSVGVLVPGLNTEILESAANAATARRFVAAGHGDVAMITYLGGRFPTGKSDIGGIIDAMHARYATDMAPRLVAFSEDVNRTVDSTGRQIPVTYIGHSYGGSILGTAERLGLTADRAIYVSAAGAGVGVDDPSDWHNRNPDVARFAMTAPLDPIEIAQGFPGGPHGADPDEMPGVVRLPTGRRLDGTLMGGASAHSDVLNEPSDAWRKILAVITGDYAWVGARR